MSRVLCLPLALLLALAACEKELPPVPTGPVERKPAHGDPLLEPDCLEMNQTAPMRFRASFETSQGTFVVEVHRDWAPHGADRFYSLVKNGFYDNNRFFRIVKTQLRVVQWGMHGSPRISEKWQQASIRDDPRIQRNVKGTVCFAASGQPNSRTTQVFVSLKDNREILDKQGFAPFGQVVEGMDVLERLYDGYGDGPPGGQGPSQQRLAREGNAYLAESFPRLDYIVKAEIVGE